MKDAAPLAIGSKPAPGDLLYVQGFVNTLDVESGSDAFAEAAGVSAWFSAHLHLPGNASVSEDERCRVVALRGALRELIASAAGAALPEEALATLNEVTARSPLALTAADAGRLALVAPDADIDGRLAELLAIVHRAQLAGTWERLKLCAADNCRWAYYDSSRNRSGAWCSMETCGNREKVRSHRAKRAPEHTTTR